MERRLQRLEESPEMKGKRKNGAPALCEHIASYPSYRTERGWSDVGYFREVQGLTMRGNRYQDSASLNSKRRKRHASTKGMSVRPTYEYDRQHTSACAGDTNPCGTAPSQATEGQPATEGGIVRLRVRALLLATLRTQDTPTRVG